MLALLRQRAYGRAMTTANSPQDDREVSSPRVLAGRTLRMMRDAHGASLRDVASRAGISPSHLSRVESGERPMTAELTQRLCDVIAELPPPTKAVS